MTRDIWEVANQLAGYVSDATEPKLAEWLMRESAAAADLAQQIVDLQKELAESDKLIVQLHVDLYEARRGNRYAELERLALQRAKAAEKRVMELELEKITHEMHEDARKALFDRPKRFNK